MPNSPRLGASLQENAWLPTHLPLRFCFVLHREKLLEAKKYEVANQTF
jgi:hypothetical protein